MEEDKITILTPEAVEFDFQLADLGSRFIAILIDTIAQLLISLPIVLLIYLIQVFWLYSSYRDPISPWILGLLFLLLFIVGFSGYYIYFEMIWNGRTPGKKLVNIRVVRDGGYPVNITSSFIRNIIRIVDFLPFYYSTGVISIIFSRDKKRLGDIVAGTMVVREYKDIPPPVLQDGLSGGEGDIGLSSLSLEKITPGEYCLIREFLLRKNHMERPFRNKLARKIAIPLIDKLNIKNQSYGDDNYILFLEQLARNMKDKDKFL